MKIYFYNNQSNFVIQKKNNNWIFNLHPILKMKNWPYKSKLNKRYTLMLPTLIVIVQAFNN